MARRRHTAKSGRRDPHDGVWDGPQRFLKSTTPARAKAADAGRVPAGSSQLIAPRGAGRHPLGGCPLPCSRRPGWRSLSAPPPGAAEEGRGTTDCAPAAPGSGGEPRHGTRCRRPSASSGRVKPTRGDVAAVERDESVGRLRGHVRVARPRPAPARRALGHRARREPEQLDQAGGGEGVAVTHHPTAASKARQERQAYGTVTRRSCPPTCSARL